MLKSHVPTASEWVTAVRNKPSCGTASRIEFILRAYQMKPGSDVEGRSDILHELESVCAEYVKSHSQTDSHFGNIMTLGMQATKQLHAIERAGKAWASAAKVFGKTSMQHGKTNALQHYGKNAAEPTSHKNYWLEGLDPKHRSWGHMDPSHFNNWKADTATNLNFFDWLEFHNLAQDLQQVQYLSPNERWRYMCVFGDDQVIYWHGNMADMRGKGDIPLTRFTTWGLKTAHSGKNYAIWVCSAGGIFYSNTHKVSEFHHSSFLAGGRTLAAGEWVVAAGKLLLISHKTGHYAASTSNLYNAICLLQHRVDTSRTVVQLTDYATSDNKFVTATDFLRNAGDGAKCDPIMSSSGAIMNMKEEAQIRCDRHIDWDGNHATNPRQFRAA